MSSNEIYKGILSDHGYFYLGTLIDGVKIRGVGAKGLVIAPRKVHRVVYMQDTSTLLAVDPNRELAGPLELQKQAMSALNSDYEVTFHEIGSLVTGLLNGTMSYMDWVRLPIIDEPNLRYVTNILKEFEHSIEDVHLALVNKMNPGYRATWMPLDYRYAQLLAFARAEKIEVNYFAALANLQENPGDWEIYEGSVSEVKLQQLSNKLRSIETNARRGIL